MASPPSLTNLPIEILHCIFSYLISEQASNQLATGQIPSTFRGIIFSCHGLYSLASAYYYNHQVFECTAAGLVWELVHMNLDKGTVQAFSRCVKQIQRLEIHVKLYESKDARLSIPHYIPQTVLTSMNLQIADLVSLWHCLERCKLNDRDTQIMKSLTLVSTSSENEKRVIVPVAKDSPINEQSMYTAVFSSLTDRIGVVNFEHRPKA